MAMAMDNMYEKFCEVWTCDFYCVMPCYSDGTGSPSHGSPGRRFWLGRVGSRVSVSDPVFDPV